jgi:hypothetical protein
MRKISKTMTARYRIAKFCLFTGWMRYRGRVGGRAPLLVERGFILISAEWKIDELRIKFRYDVPLKEQVTGGHMLYVIISSRRSWKTGQVVVVQMVKRSRMIMYGLGL